MIAAITVGLAVSAAITAYLAWTLAAGHGAYVWLRPGFWFSDAVAWFAPPRSEAAEGWHAALGLAVSWAFWGAVGSALLLLIYRLLHHQSAT